MKIDSIGRDETLFNGHTYWAHSEMCSLRLTHPSTRSLVLGAVGSYCTVPGEQWEWGGEGGCPVPCSRAPRQGRRWTGTSLSRSPHSIFRSGRGIEPAHSRSPYWLSHCRKDTNFIFMVSTSWLLCQRNLECNDEILFLNLHRAQYHVYLTLVHEQTHSFSERNKVDFGLKWYILAYQKAKQALM